MAMKRRTLYIILIAIAVILFCVILVSLLVLLLGKTPPTNDRMSAVKEMMGHAWKNYRVHAWGKNELKPLSNGSSGGDLGATIVDSLDTLYLMGMMDEFREGRDWVRDHLRIGEVDSDLSVLKTTTRFIGGLLSCFALTGDSLFRDKAAEVADALLPAFDTPTGLPSSSINPKTTKTSKGDYVSLAETGTLHLEFTYLSDVTGYPVYKEKVDAIRQVLRKATTPDNLYPNYFHATDIAQSEPGTVQSGHITLSAGGDSFYEYLLKSWLVSGQTDEQARNMFDEAMEAALDKVKMYQISPSGLGYLAELIFGEIVKGKMDHLSCFAGGMFALASTTLDNSMSARYMEVAENLTNTCHESYIRSETRLGPKTMRFSDKEEATTTTDDEKSYNLWPETFESYFIMWRLTKKQQYRDWGWEAVEALKKHCRVDGGYAGLRNVYDANSDHTDEQPSYFLAESLKYLYLLFADDSLLPLDMWVFNTEAHPLPVRGRNPQYRSG